jgi:hypothetical protein
MPQYAALIYVEDLDRTTDRQSEETKLYAEFGAENAAAIRGGAALYPTSTATTVRVRGGRGGDVVTSDGPYAETKEVLGGFYLLEAADLDEATALAARIPGAWGPGGIELRPVIPMHTSNA